MKKTLFSLILALLAVSCSSDDEQINPTEDRANEIAHVLNGKFVGSELSETTNMTRVTEITFSPYASPKTEEWIDNTISKSIIFYGTCEVVEYYDDHLLESSRNWKYSINIAYEGAQPKLDFYPDVYGRTESHTISIINNSSFVLDDITYNKDE